MKPKLFALLLFIPLALVALPSTAQDRSRAFADDTWSSGRIAAAVAQTGVHQNGVATTTPPSCTLSANPPSLPPSGGNVTLLANCTGSPPLAYRWSGPGVNGQTTAQVSTSISNNATFSVIVGNGSGSFTGSITVPVAIAMSPATLSNGVVNADYSQTLTAIGGTGSYTFSVPSGTLPPGLQLSSTGVLSGKPSTAGRFQFTITVTDTANGKDTRVYDVVITQPPITLAPATLPNGTVNTDYSQTLTASGGTGSYTFSVPPGTLPPGLQLSSTGVLSGKPSTAGRFQFTITVTDTANGKDARVYNVVITQSTITLAPATLPNGTVNIAYPATTISASGGTGPYTFAVTNGALPAGINLDSNSGALTGSPSAAGTSAFTITATDALKATGIKGYTIVVNQPTVVTLTPASLPAGTVGTPYTQTIVANGGVGTFTFAVTQGTLPPDIKLSSTGVLSGTPQSVGTSSFTVTASSASGSGSQAYTLTINAPIVVQPASIPGGTVDIAYSQSFTATGGSGAYTFSVQGALPAGLTFSGSTLSGKPTTASNTTFTVVATDTRGATGSRLYALAITPPNATRVTQVSAKTQTGTAGQPLPSPLVVLVTDTSGTPVTGASSQLTSTSTTPGDVIAPPIEPAGKPGQYSFNVTLASSTAQRTITICLAPPASQCVGFVIGTTQQVGQDARQIIGPQAVAAITAPTQQLDNITQHLDNRRLMRNPSVVQGLNVSFNGQALPPMSAFALAPAGKDAAEPAAGGGAAADDPFARWGFFVQGVIDIGKADATSLSPGFDIDTKGLTFGTDYRLDKGVVGAALGLTKADTDLAGSGGNQDTRGWSISLFGEYVPVENAYIDLILNWGQNKYDTSRHGTDPAGIPVDFNSSPKGNQFGASLSAGYQFYYQQLTASPYVRAEYVNAKIDAFAESGGANSIEVSGQRYSSTVLTLGGLAQYAWSQSWGVLVPYARLEFQYAAQSSSDAVSAQYAIIGLSNDPVGVALPGSDKSFGTISVGATTVLPRGVSGYFNYQYLFGKDDFNDSRFTLGVRVEF